MQKQIHSLYCDKCQVTEYKMMLRSNAQYYVIIVQYILMFFVDKTQTNNNEINDEHVLLNGTSRMTSARKIVLNSIDSGLVFLQNL